MNTMTSKILILLAACIAFGVFFFAKKESTRKEAISSMTQTITAGELLPRSAYANEKEDDLKKRLTPLQYSVTKQQDTERPFNNAYWDNKEEGIYVDIVSGAPLFSSKEKYKSGTGWPSFWKPINEVEIVEKADRGIFGARVEIRSKTGDAHLGHVFDDGPQPTGLRYCMNSAALTFIPKDKLEPLGYGEYLKLFKDQ
jgi:methionine-R-sulfoxide reductase